MTEGQSLHYVSKLKMHVVTQHAPVDSPNNMYYRSPALDLKEARQQESKYAPEALHESGWKTVNMYICGRGPGCPTINGFFSNGKCNEGWAIFLPPDQELKIE